jgi:integrase
VIPLKWTVIQRGKKFTAIIELGKDPLTGKRKQKWLSGFASPDDADIGAVEYIKKYEKGLLVDSKNVTVGDFLKYWLEQKVEPRSSPTTYSSYKIMVDMHILPALDSFKLPKLETDDIQRLINTMRKKGYSHRTLKYCLDILNIAFNFAIEKRFVEKNPCKGVIVPEDITTGTQIKTYSSEEVEILLQNTKDKPIYLPILLAVTCGLRRGEILALRWSDINFSTKTIRINKSRVRNLNDEVFEKIPKTKSSIRTIAVPEVTMAALQLQKEKCEKNKQDLGEDKYNDQGYVVCWDDGTPYRPDYVTKAFEKMIKRLNLPKITFHDLRHTHATLLLEAGVHPKVVQERLGHSTISMTLDTYSHVLPNIQQEAATHMDNILK